MDADANGLRFLTEQKGIAKLEELIPLYNNAEAITPFIKAYWYRRLSAGEQSMLTLFSRFWNVLDQARNNEIANNVFVLLDEPDVCFHPEWQKKTVKMLLDFLAKVAFPGRSVQVILTANSPYILSDIPRDNVTFLRREKEAPYRVSARSGTKHDEMGETFGANIHSLLAHSFFMEQSLMGDFARERIGDLINWLKGTPRVPREMFTPEAALRLINLIGEPLLQDRLRALYEEKAKQASDPEFLQRLISMKERELMHLRHAEEASDDSRATQ